MTIGELVTIIIIFLIAGIILLISILHFMEKGVLFNNAYIYASKQERQTMDKRPLYRQSAIIFCLLSIVFLIIGLSLALHNDSILFAEIPVIIGTIGYAIISSVHIN